MSAGNSSENKKNLMLIPIAVLIIAALLAQVFFVSTWVQQRRMSNEVSFCPQTLCLVNYNYNRDRNEISVTLYNSGSDPVTITDVVYDGNPLIQGIVGPPNDPTIMPTGGPSVSASDIIFPDFNHWNMNTQGQTTPTILPGAIATLFLGESTFNVGSIHILKITAQGQTYAFILESKPLD
jgi:archaellum component FlaF (FlaF/FlaG flagellin family)